MILILLIIPIGLAYAQTGTACFEDGSYCDFATRPLEAVMQPIIAIGGDWTYVIIWGGILGGMYLKTHNAGIVAILGVFYGGILATGLISDQVMQIGYALVGITIGIYAFIIFMKAQYT